MSEIKIKTIGEMTIAELRAVPFETTWGKETECWSLVILPGKGTKKELHDSGYRTMSFVATDENAIPIIQLSGSSDIICFEGIGGYGYHWLQRFGKTPETVEVGAWEIDCLPKSGLLRLFCRGKIICGPTLSTFEIYSKRKP